MSRERSPEELLRHVAERAHGLAEEITAATRDDLDALVAEVRAAQRLAFGPRPKAARGEGALHKIRDYLVAHVGESVSGEELDAISGIHEWPRRVRELRVEHGYDIRELGGSLYRLEGTTPDAERAAHWTLLNGIRNRDGSGRDRVAALFEARVGRVVTRDELDYVARIKEGVRRVRELRDEFGWPIDSHIDDPGLRPGEYRLLSTDPDDRRDPLQRLYPEKLRQKVFERDHYTCQDCQRDRGTALAAGDTRFYLELHHKVAIADEIDALPKEQRNDPENLLTLCHSDHIRRTRELHRQKQDARRRERT